MKSSTTEEPKMETRVLMPPEFSLVVTPRPLPPLDRLVPREDCIKLCATYKIAAHTHYLPFSGTVRADKLPQLPYLSSLDVRARYGGYDAVDEASRRICNWVRFLKITPLYGQEVNLLGRRVGPRGDVLFEVVRDVPPGEQLVCFLLPEATPEEAIFLPALQVIRSSLVKRTIDSIMAEAPLDLSLSLLRSPDEASSPSSKSPPSSPEREQDSPSSPESPSHFSPFLSSSVLSFAPPRPIFSPSTGLLTPTSTITTPPGPPKRRERTMLPCSECGKAFDRPSLLKRHIRTHTGEKPHVCDVCGKGFSTSSSLNTHRRIHSGEKPHQCAICGKRFTASSNLYYHRMTHVKEKPHKCALCTRSFPTPGDLRSHMFVHNGQWPHKCSVCGKGFSKLTNLRNHALLHSAKTRSQPTSLPSVS